MNEALKNIIEDAKNQLTNNKGILKDSPIIQQFVEARKNIDAAASTKNPLVKEYIDIHKEAEKNPNSTIGRMTRAMKNVAAQHMIYATAMEMSNDEEEKQRLKQMMDELAKHPAVIAYGKYIEGLRYLSGEIYEVSPEVEEFFYKELSVPLQDHNSKYEMYRLGVDEYIKQETERLDKLEAELKIKLPQLEKRQQELDEKERAEGTIHPDLLKVLDEEIALQKERETFEREKESMNSSTRISKSQDLVNREGKNKLKKSSFIRKYGSGERRDLLNEKDTLENNIKSIPTKKEQLNIKKSPEDQEKMDEYQKAIAKMKARELYSKQALGFGVLRDNFIGDYVDRKDKVKMAPFGDRQTPGTVCVAMMLMKGYKLEEIMDPTALLDEKKEIGQEYINHRQAGDVQWYVKTMYDGSIAMMDAFKKYVKEHKDELKTEQDLAMHAGTLGALSMLCFDMYQELSNCKFADNGNLYKTIDEYNAIQDIICGYDVGAALGAPLEIKYDIERLPADTVATELRRQLRTKMLLEEIQKENPDIDSVAIDIPKQASVDNQLITMQEFKKMYGNVMDININNISKESAKQLAFMQSMEFVDKNNIRFDRVKHPTKVTKAPETIGFPIEKDEQLECVVSSNGKQLVATDIPVRVEDCFKNIESKDIRGKAKDNSAEFNNMMDKYDKALQNIGYEKTDTANLETLKELKEAAAAYITAKRAQKGYESKKILDFNVDMKMLGKEKGGKSIFTAKGKDRYEFALEIVTNIVNLEKEYGKNELQKQNAEIQQPEQDNMEIQEMEQDTMEK